MGAHPERRRRALARPPARASPRRRPAWCRCSKGNGYGFGIGRLARRAQWLADQGFDVDTVAVGTYEELPEVAQRFHGDLLVMTPWRPFGAALDLPDDLAGRVVHTVSREADLRRPARAAPRRPLRARAAHQHAAARPHRPRAARRRRVARRRPGRPARGRRAAPAARPGIPPRRRCGGCSTTSSPPGSRSARARDGVGQPPHARRAGHAAGVVRRLPDPAPDRHRPLARRPRRAPGDRDRARRPRGRAGRRVRLPRPVRAEGRPPAGRQRRHRPRHRARVADRRHQPQGPRARPWPAAASTPSASSAAPFTDRRQAAAVRRATAHAGLDAVPAAGRTGARRSARRSTSGSATPPPASTGSSSADVVGTGRSSYPAPGLWNPRFHDAMPGTTHSCRSSHTGSCSGLRTSRDHHRGEVALGGHPDHDRDPVEAGVAAARRVEVAAEVPPDGGEVEELARPARPAGRATAAGPAPPAAAATGRTAASRPC